MDLRYVNFFDWIPQLFVIINQVLNVSNSLIVDSYNVFVSFYKSLYFIYYVNLK